MFDNVVRLIGFVGSDAELKTTKTQREFTVLSLATTASWKDKNGDGYIRRTEWHRLVAWRNLSTFAATLKKGAHVSVAEAREHGAHSSVSAASIAEAAWRI